MRQSYLKGCAGVLRLEKGWGGSDCSMRVGEQQQEGQSARTEEDNEQEGCVRISNHQVVHLQYLQLKINK